MNLTDNDIIEALEYCTGEKRCFDGCPFKAECGKDLDALEKACLDLINRKDTQITELTEENEDIKRIVGLMNKRQYYRKFVDEVFRKQKGKELTDPDFDYIYQLYFEQKAEIERLKKKDNDWAISYANAVARSVKAKDESIKEFAGLLKHLINKDLYHSGRNIAKKIDNLVKEMVGE